MLIKLITNVLFPPVCVSCRKRIARGVVCKPCLSGIEIRETLLCGQCFGPLPASAVMQTRDLRCHPDFPYFLAAAGRYDDKTLQSLVHHLKFRSIKEAAEPLAELICRHIGKSICPEDLDLAGFIAVPMPLSRKRFRARGYNQAALIAERVAATLGTPVAADALVREKHTRPQSEAESVDERRENIRGAFAVREPAAVRGQNILLIDDVTTTGATLLEASLALKAAGAETILALAAAKTR